MGNNIFRKSIGLVAATLFCGSVASASGIQIDGFASVYYNQSQGDIMNSGVLNRNANFSSASMLGLNLYSKMDGALSMKGQLIGYGNPPGTPAGAAPNERTYLVSLQWGFLNWDISNSTAFQMGRLLYPTWISAEYFNVGYLLPYRAIPGSVFMLAPFKSFDGASISHSIGTDAGKIILSAFGGTPVYDALLSGGTSLTLSNFWGASAALEGDGWQVKATFSSNTSEIELPAPYSFKGSAITDVTTVGIKYDKHNIVFWSDYIMSKAKDGGTDGIGGPGTKYNDNSSGGYALLGYRIGKFLPRYTYAEASEEMNLVAVGKQKLVTQVIGLNYEVNMQAVAKLEYETREVKEGNGGNAVHNIGTGKDGSTIYAGFDFMF